eukprot:10129603-Lingulodinium_polyedra.AAC.1
MVAKPPLSVLRADVLRGAALVLQALGYFVVGVVNQGRGLVLRVAARVDVRSLRIVILRPVSVHRSSV